MRIKLFEDYKTRNFTVDDIVSCIDNGGVVYASVVKGLPGNDPGTPLRPVSVDDSGVVTVSLDGSYHEVRLSNVDRIEWSGPGAGRVYESLNVSDDLATLLRALDEFGDKVANFLMSLMGSDVYSDDEEVNYLELSREVNKFSFMPTKRRSRGSENFDSESMPTRIGKIVRKIFKTAEKAFEFKYKDNAEIKIVSDSFDDMVRGNNGGRPSKGGMTRYEVRVGKSAFLNIGNVSMSLKVDGNEVDAKFHNLDYDYVQAKGGWSKVEKVVFDTPAIIEEGSAPVKLALKSDFTITDSDIEGFVNAVVAYLKANRSGDDTVMQEVSGEDIRFWYNRENYQSTRGQLGSSCMSGEYCQDFFDIYCENPDRVSMLVLLSKEELLIGRALLWNLDSGRRFMDRVYTVLDSDARVFMDHARKNGWLYKFGRHEIMDGKKDFEGVMTVTLKNHDFSQYPYLDTLKYLSYRGVLSNVGDSEDKYLNSTDGDYSYDEEQDDY